ncbi:MAG: rRNA synthase [Actinomycetota bacterium]|nr:rRNA synthase [Actinomycetota bacterium]
MSNVPKPPKPRPKPKRPAQPTPARGAGSVPEGVRLQKLLAGAGIASRRRSEDLIRRGLVTVDGRTAVLGERVDPTKVAVEVEGRRVSLDPGKLYYALNKPAGVVTTSKDPEGRTTVLDLLGFAERVLPVGRLDAPTEGLLLLTNDGELSHRLAHPSYEVPRTYVAEVKGEPGRGALRRLTEEGVPIPQGGTARADSVTVVDVRPGRDARSLVEVVVHEGRKHVVRNMLAAVDLPVVRLVRTQFGPLRLDRLAPGSYRRLSQAEVAALYEAVGL